MVIYPSSSQLLHLIFVLEFLSEFAIIAPCLTAPHPPLYGQDPHDVRHPSLPGPLCSPALNKGFDISSTILAIEAFCEDETGIVSSTSQHPVSKAYIFPGSDGGACNIRLILAWESTGTCRRSQLTLSPAENSGKVCKTIFRNILSRCEYYRSSAAGFITTLIVSGAFEQNLAQSNGGSVAWNCGSWSLGFDEGADGMWHTRAPWYYGQDRIWAGLGGRTLGVYQALTAIVTCNIAITKLVAMLVRKTESQDFRTLSCRGLLWLLGTSGLAHSNTVCCTYRNLTPSSHRAELIDQLQIFCSQLSIA